MAPCILHTAQMIQQCPAFMDLCTDEEQINISMILAGIAIDALEDDLEE